MGDRRLVGIDLGISSAHTVRVLAGDGSVVCRRKAVPTVASLVEVERAALQGAVPGTRLEVVLEPTGPSWLPIAVFFIRRGHAVYRVSSGLVPTTFAGCCRGRPRQAASTPPSWRACRWSTRPGCTHLRCPAPSAPRWTAACAPATGSPSKQPSTSAASRTWSASCCPQAPWSVTSATPTWRCWRWRAPAPTPTRCCGVARPGLAGCSARQQDTLRAAPWLQAAHAWLQLDDDHPAVAFTDLAAEVHTEVRLPKGHPGRARPPCRPAGVLLPLGRPAGAGRSLPGLACVGGPALTATIGPAHRFPNASKFRSFTGLAPRASETGHTDRKGQPISKAGNRLLRTTLVRAADTARRQDPQLARLYQVQMVQRGNGHLGAVCVVAAHLAERAWTVMDRGMPYVICDTDNTPVSPEQAKRIIAQHWTVPEEVRRRRRSSKTKGKAPQQVLAGPVTGAQGATRRPSPPASLGRQDPNVKPAHQPA
jgi:hypothetical protein